MRWAHYAHCKDLFIKAGDRVKKGQRIATLGNSGTSAPHLHFEIWRIDPARVGYNYYPYGLSRAQVDQIYENPEGYRTNTNPTQFHHYGYRYLDKVSGANVYHPGIDLNGPGQDLGNSLYACFDGVIQWVGRNVSGWGNHFYIRQEAAPTPPPPPGDNEMIYIKDFSDGDFNKMMDLFFLKGNYSYTGPQNKQEWLAAYGNLNLWQFLEKGYQHGARDNFVKKLYNAFSTGKMMSKKDFYDTSIKPPQ